MLEVFLFVEDHAHEAVISALVKRMAGEAGFELRLHPRNTRRGHGAVVRELRQFLRHILRGSTGVPDLIIVATDANCVGLNERTRVLAEVTSKEPVRAVHAVPDPHVERWLLLDSAAFKAVFDRGCQAPDQKCERSRYKKMVVDAIRESGITPSLGGIEFAEDIVAAMDLDRAAQADRSFRRFVDDLQAFFKERRQPPAPT